MKINLGYPSQTEGGRGSSFTNATTATTTTTSHHASRGGGRGGAARGRGHRSNRGGVSGGNGNDASAADLDASLDDYFANRGK
jgi:hypothetical protein